MTKAFVLGAGLGTRLRPLTDQLPKPLIPVHHQPLVVRAFEHLRAAGVQDFVVNTHHLPEAWPAAFPQGSWEGGQVVFRHEPVLLETGGGLANVADLLQEGPFWVYNGDILTDIPLEPAWDAHLTRGNLVTLLLRSDAPVRNAAFDAAEGRVLDLRNSFGLNHPDQRGFTGLYVVSPGFFRYLIPGKIESVVAGLLRAMAAGERIGGVLADGGQWLDLGDRDSYLAAHAAGRSAGFPSYAPWSTEETAVVHAEARVAGDTQIDADSSVGPGAIVEAGAVLQASVVWPGGRVAAGAHLTRCVVRSGQTAAGDLVDQDI
jgi:mannose-1-phosphate guanylyltransferase